METAPTAMFATEGESLARRAHRLLAEAKEAANGQVALLEEALAIVHALALDVADGGEIYPIGVRDLARKTAEDAAWCTQTIGSIMIGAGARRTKVELHLVDAPEPEVASDRAEPAAPPPAAGAKPAGWRPFERS